jgi:hypothetical protein
LLFKNPKIHQDSNSQNDSSLGNVKEHSLTLSYTPKSMRCDSWASFLAHTFASPCFACEPKAKVTTFHVVHRLYSCNFVAKLYITPTTDVQLTIIFTRSCQKIIIYISIFAEIVGN